MYKVSMASHAGRLHQSKNMPCQDYVWCEKNNRVLCCALSDGAGSRSNSALGAECLTKYVTKIFCENFDQFWHMEYGVLVHTFISRCISELSKENVPLSSLASTLMFYAMHQDGRFVLGHIGDGIIMRSTKEGLNVISYPENGEYENETFFITSVNADEHLRIQKGDGEPASAVLMMSDGMAASMYQKNTRQPAPVCAKIIQWLQDGDETVISGALKYNMQNVFSKKTYDDMSLIVMCKGER